MRFFQRSRRRSSRGHVRIEPTAPWSGYTMWAAIIFGAVVVLLLVITQVVAPLFERDKEPSHNRTWLEYEWTRAPINQDAVFSLGQRLKENEIDRVYVESFAWLTDGSFIEGEYAAEFAAKLREAYPDIEILLWIRMSAEQIANETQRIAVTDVAAVSTRDWGFDGVQLNGYGVVNQSESLVTLVRSLRDAMGQNALLSVTVPPDRIPSDPDVPVGTTVDPNLTWDLDYKQRIALLDVDELVVMAHASGLENPVEYEAWVAYQVVSYAEALSELDRPGVLVVAVPTYETAPEHDPAVEDVRSAVRGVQGGIKQAGKAGSLVIGIG